MSTTTVFYNYIGGEWRHPEGPQFENRNPATGEAIKIKAKTVVRLRAAKAFKDAVLK